MTKPVFDNLVIKNNKAVSNRPARVAKEIQVILSDIFLKSQLKDSLLFDKMVLISDVFLSRDLSLARVYISPWNIDADKQLILKTLNKYIPFFRRKIAKTLRTKVIPDIIFLIDDQFDRLDTAREMFKTLETNNEDS